MMAGWQFLAFGLYLMREGLIAVFRFPTGNALRWGINEPSGPTDRIYVMLRRLMVAGLALMLSVSAVFAVTSRN